MWQKIKFFISFSFETRSFPNTNQNILRTVCQYNWQWREIVGNSVETILKYFSQLDRSFWRLKFSIYSERLNSLRYFYWTSTIKVRRRNVRISWIFVVQPLHSKFNKILEKNRTARWKEKISIFVRGGRFSHEKKYFNAFMHVGAFYNLRKM